MIEAYRSGVPFSQEEATGRAIEIAKEAKKSTDMEIWNSPGSPTNKGKKQKVDTIYDIFYLLTSSGPLYCYYSAKDGSESHLIVLTGVDLSCDAVYTNNPWGYKGIQTFIHFQNGFVNGDGEIALPDYPLIGVYLITGGKRK